MLATIASLPFLLPGAAPLPTDPAACLVQERPELAVLRDLARGDTPPLRHLERVLLEYKLDGDAERTLVHLRALRLLAATGEGGEGSAARSVPVFAALTGLLLDLGRLEEAEALLEDPLPGGDELAGLEGLPVAPRASWPGRELATAWRRSSEHADLRARLERERSTGDVPAFVQATLEPWAVDWLRREVGLPSEEMVEAATRMLQGSTNRDWKTWSRFLPSLALLALAEVSGQTPAVPLEAYATLVSVDAALAADLAWTALPHGVAAWRREVVRTLQLVRGHSDAWLDGAGGDRSYFQPRWVDVLTVLYRERPEDPELREQVRILLHHQALHGPLAQAIGERLRTSRLAQVETLLQDLGVGAGFQLARLLPDVLAGPDPELHARFIALLGRRNAASGLVEAARAGVPGARRAFVEACTSSTWFQVQELYDLVMELVGVADEEEALAAAELLRGMAPRPESAAQLLVAALRSPHASVAALAAETVLERNDCPRELVLEVAEHRLPALRIAFLREWRVAFGRQPGQELLPVLLRRVEDPDAGVRRVLDELLTSPSGLTRNNPFSFDAFVDLMLDRAERGPDGVAALCEDETAWRDFAERNPQTLERSSMFVRLGAIGDMPMLVDLGLELALPFNWTGGVVEGLPDDALDYVLRNASERFFRIEGRPDLSGAELGDRGPVLRRIALDPEVHPYRRLFALDRVRVDAGGDEARVLVELLSRPEWRAETFRLPNAFLEALPSVDGGANRILIELLDEEGLAPGIRDRAAGYLDIDGEEVWPAVQRLVALYESGELRTDWWDVAHMARLEPRPELTRAMIRMLDSGSPDEASDAAIVLRAHRAPEATAALGRALQRPGMERWQAEVVRALLATGSPEALPHLRAGLLVARNGDVTAEIRSAIERLESFLAHRDTPSQGLPSREVAEARLVSLLESSSEAQRVEAIRALGTLGAVEALPVLIPLLEDPSEAVRAATRDALERLHRAAGGER